MNCSPVSARDGAENVPRATARSVQSTKIHLVNHSSSFGSGLVLLCALVGGCGTTVSGGGAGGSGGDDTGGNVTTTSAGTTASSTGGTGAGAPGPGSGGTGGGAYALACGGYTRGYP